MTVAFYAYNKTDTATITASTENASFPLSNLKDPRRTKTYRSTTNADTVVFDLGSAQTIEAVFVMAHSLNGFNVATITAQFNSTNTWGAPAVTKTLTIDTTNGVALSEFTAISYRYCRLVLTSTSGFCELAKVYIGAKNQYVESDFTYPLTTNVDDLSIVTKNRYGQKFFDVVSKQKTITGSFEYIASTDIDSFLDMLLYVSITKPLFISFAGTTVSGLSRLTGMYYVKTETSPKLNMGNFWSLTLSLEEAK